MDGKEIKSINSIPICDETARSRIVKKLDKNQGNENAGKLLVVDEDGYVKLSDPDDIDFNNQYVLPIATSEVIGGVKPTTKTNDMTKEVGVDSNGRLYVKPDVTDAEKEEWNNKSDFDGSYNSLKDKPNFKTVNGVPIIGDGDIAVSGGSSVTVDTALNKDSDNAISNKAVTAELNKKASLTDLGINIVNKSANDTDVTLENNTYYVFPAMTTLTITPPTADDGKLSICGFEFTSGSIATSLTLKNCTLTNSDDVVENKTYEVNILNGNAIVRAR